ncbi:hypothetical protein BDZ91DRAFT_773026 [Kalaharituber pfeilii]|nr:hypothetical protein BDZ91DRAFT_773026 [Kalaharituber pfeilii]
MSNGKLNLVLLVSRGVVAQGIFDFHRDGRAWVEQAQIKGYAEKDELMKIEILVLLKGVLGSSILFSYPACSALPLMVFAVLGPIIRRKLPEGFIMTSWVRHRDGEFTDAYISFLTLATMFLYMITELSALQQVIESIADIDCPRVIIVQVIVTAIYTSLGGFKVSFTTDNIQGVMICGLIIICAIAIGTTAEIDETLIEPSGLLKPSRLGYQLLYIFLVAIGFWMRTFASCIGRNLAIGISIATFIVFIILGLVGTTWLIAVWSGIENPGSLAFFMLVAQLLAWDIGIVVVMISNRNPAVFDSFQSAMGFTASNDLFRNRINLIWIYGLVALNIIPVIIIAIKSPSILRIYLSPISLHAAAKLLILESLYANGWSVFGTFLTAPINGLLITALTLSGLRWLRFDAFHRLVELPSAEEVSAVIESDEEHSDL